MKKILIAFFLLVGYIANGQIYVRPNTSYGTVGYRSDNDSAWSYPTGCGIPTDSTFLRLGTGPKIRSLKKAYQYYDSCGHHNYIWDPSLRFWHISDSSSGGSGPSDTSFLRTTLNHNTTVNAASVNSLTFDNLDNGLFFKGVQLLTASDNTYVLVRDSVTGRIYNIPAAKADTTGVSAIIAAGGIAFAYYDLLTFKVKFQAIPTGPFTKTGNIIRTTVNTDTLIAGAVAFPKSKNNFAGGIQNDGGLTGKNTVTFAADTSQNDSMLLTATAPGSFFHKHLVTTINGSNPAFGFGAHMNKWDWTNANISQNVSNYINEFTYRENAANGSTRDFIPNVLYAPSVGAGDSLRSAYAFICQTGNPVGILSAFGVGHLVGTGNYPNVVGAYGIYDDNFTVGGPHEGLHSNLAWGINNSLINGTGGARSHVNWIEVDSIKMKRLVKSSGVPWIDVISKTDSLHKTMTLDPAGFSVTGDTVHVIGGGGGSGTLARIGPLDSLPAVAAGAQVNGTGIFMQTSTNLYAGLESALHKNTMDSLIAGTKKIKVNFYKLGQPGYSTMNSSSAGDSLLAFTYRDSLDFHTAHNPDSSRTQYVQAHDTISANALASQFRLDSVKKNIYAAIAGMVGGSQSLQQTLAIGDTTNIAIRSSDSIAMQLGLVRTVMKMGDTLAAVGRKIDYFFGTSIEAGYLLPDVSRSWPNQFCDLRGDSANTFSTLTGGKLVPTMTGQINTIPVYDSTKFNFLLFEYGLNDTTTRAFFKSEYMRIIDSATSAHYNWPKNKIFIISAPYGGGSHQIDSIYSHAAIEAAIIKGVRFIDFYTYTLTHGYFATLNASDSLHPNVRGAGKLSNCAFNTIRDSVGGLEVNQLVVNKVSTFRSTNFFNGINNFNGDIYLNDSIRNTAKFHDGVMIAGDGNIVEQRWIAYNGGPTNKFGIGVGNSGAGSYFLELYGGQAGGGVQNGTLTSNVFTATTSATSTGLGIFNKSPTVALDVTGAAKVSGNTTLSGALLVTGDNNPVLKRIGLYSSGNEFFGLGVGNQPGVYRTIITSPSDQGGVDIGTISSADGVTYSSIMSASNVSGTKRVGIVQTTPTHALDVNGDTRIVDSLELDKVRDGNPATDSIAVLHQIAAGKFSVNKIAASAIPVSAPAYRFSQTAAGTAVTNTTTLTSIFGTGTGSRTIAANTLVVGQVITIHGWIQLSTSTGLPTLVIYTAPNSTTGGSSGTTMNLIPSMTNQVGELNITCTVLSLGTGGTGTGQISTWGTLKLWGTTQEYQQNSNTMNINTTISNNFDVLAGWGAASSSDSINSFPQFTLDVK